MLFTIYGDTVRFYGGEISSGTLARLMGELGFSAQAVRAAVGRLVRQGWMTSRRVGRRSFCTLTERGRRRVEHGTRRVYGMRGPAWDRTWHLLTYTIPEGRRTLRDRLRRELIWLGMGQLSASTWISPYDLSAELDPVIESHGLTPHVLRFTARHVGPNDDRLIVRRAWDLDRVQAWYEEFIRAQRPHFRRLREEAAVQPMPDSRCFTEKTLLVHEYRKLLHVDPGLPDELLPPGWKRGEAARLFFDAYHMVADGARRFFESVFEPPPGWERPAFPPDPFAAEVPAGMAFRGESAPVRTPSL